jgi:hypothetical protein
MKKIALLWLVMAATGLLISCAANDPFDPNSVENNKPTVKLFIAPIDEDGELNPTSYFERTFNWSGSDNDGWVTEFYVSIRSQANIPAAWDTTTSQDTTMTFYTNEEGVSEATFYIACKDNRGAVSDTLVQYVPLRNFAPTVNFKSDFEPLVNMQRVISESPADTTYWNYGACNFRFFALDEDGASTMDPFYRYTLMDISGGDPDITFDVDDPAADPDLGWVQVPFSPDEEIKEFEIFVKGTSPSTNKTLTVSVGDEAFADTRFSYSWEVREPQSNILYVKDGPYRAVYHNFMDGIYGEGQWDSYDFWFGYPDSDFTFLETMRMFELVLWTDGGSTSDVMRAASDRDGALQELVLPTDGAEPGKFMLISKAISGSGSMLSPAFIQTVLGISPTGAPESPLSMVVDKQALGLQGHLPAMTTTSAIGGGMGVVLRTGTEAIYQMEECVRCYTSRRPPWDPLVGTRWPERTTDPDATVVVIGLQLEYFDEAEVHAALQVIVNTEFGVVTP